jgi:hypothetical protein
MSDVLKRLSITAISNRGKVFHRPFRSCDALALAMPLGEKRNSIRTAPDLLPRARVKRSQICCGVSAGEKALLLSALHVISGRSDRGAFDIATPVSPMAAIPNAIPKRLMR